MEDADRSDDIIEDSFNGSFSASFTQIRDRNFDIISSTSSSSAETSPIAIRRSSRQVINSSDNEDITNEAENKENCPDSSNHRDGNVVEVKTETNIIELSSDEENNNADVNPPKNQVNRRQYQEQVELLRILQNDILKIENTLRVVNITRLPDQGQSIIEKHEQLKTRLQQAKIVLKSMVVDEKQVPTVNFIKTEWDVISSGVNEVQPKTFGKKGIATYQEQKALTTDLLEKIHNSLENCPKENDLVSDPINLRIELMPHQKYALSWLLWREKSKPSGGILADDMGLGKTLTMIALIMKSLELKNDEEESSDDESEDDDKKTKYDGGTLVICPASVVNQWESEIRARTARGALSVNLYHGPKREEKAKALSRYNVVLTTYTIVKNEGQKNGILFRIRWRRIILDEAHQIRNHKSQTSESVCQLTGKLRWGLTGTPVHNKELDVYSLLKFIKCTPFDNLQVWKRWVADKSTGGQERLRAVIGSLMLRRTKAELIEIDSLQTMPERKWELIQIRLQENENDIYQKILLFSRTLFATFLHQRAEKNSEILEHNNLLQQRPPNDEYFKMREKLFKFHKRKEIKQHEILVLLLRLRQVCCHPYLISQMLDGNENLGNADTGEESEELNLLEQLNNLDLNDEDHQQLPINQPNDNVTLKEASRGFFKASNPVFSKDSQSSKVKVLLELLKEKIATGDKIIIVSSWPSFLTLIGGHLNKKNISFIQLDGKIPVNKRQPLIDDFNNPKHPVRVLLLSLTAGGVGLNLIGGNHLFLMDLHWNPQMENQAQDRIYRVGQKKPVFIYKLMVENSIEERIKGLQDIKLEIAEKITQGSKDFVTNKLSLKDLKMLFDM